MQSLSTACGRSFVCFGFGLCTLAGSKQNSRNFYHRRMKDGVQENMLIISFASLSASDISRRRFRRLHVRGAQPPGIPAEGGHAGRGRQAGGPPRHRREHRAGKGTNYFDTRNTMCENSRFGSIPIGFSSRPESHGHYNCISSQVSRSLCDL